MDSAMLITYPQSVNDTALQFNIFPNGRRYMLLYKMPPNKGTFFSTTVGDAI
jgi:hypothetical protein